MTFKKRPAPTTIPALQAWMERLGEGRCSLTSPDKRYSVGLKEQGFVLYSRGAGFRRPPTLQTSKSLEALQTWMSGYKTENFAPLLQWSRYP